MSAAGVQEDRLAQFERSLTNHRPSDEGLAEIVRVRDAAKALAGVVISSSASCREQSLALTALEETVMWAVKAIALQTGEPT